MKKISFLSLLLVFPFFFTGCVKNKIIPDPSYAIGTVFLYQNPGGDYNEISINYTYIIAGEEYDNQYSSGGSGGGKGWSIPGGDYQSGDMFMVQYDGGCVNSGTCNDVHESRMLFNYPVHDSADYNNYVAQFAVTPPKP